MTSQETTSCGLIDLTGIPLSELWKLGRDDVLAHALRRVTEATDNKAPETVSAFNSAI